MYFFETDDIIEESHRLREEARELRKRTLKTLAANRAERERSARLVRESPDIEPLRKHTIIIE